ncbi:hypothetical protein Ccrd_008919 [Cynara cardunculus var. scolymus]|uniref:Uncharacterized protein n=2 Tax=Cynara cardunculus var. scolymus TaxID=59895 RepID=A0A103XE67_CYNCS|nr:hypothetical protein Ccrd_008919 [Cynara cardunculus var. scolymus]
MDTELFANNTGFVGEAKVYVEEILDEGNETGFIELTPKPYNVVLDDETYKGEVKIGLKFISNTVINERGRGLADMEGGIDDTVWKKLVDFCKMTWLSLPVLGRKLNPDEYKRI